MKKNIPSKVIISSSDINTGFHKFIHTHGLIEDGFDIRGNMDAVEIGLEGYDYPEQQVWALEALYHGLCRYYSKNLDIDYSGNIGNKLNKDFVTFKLISARPY